jgi:hypothetical protein
MTIGQFSVWLDVQKMPPERRWEANLLPLVWDLPAGHTEDEVWEALGKLAMRHESMRTTYYIDPQQGPRQQLGAHDAASVLAQVKQGSTDISKREDMVDRAYRTVIDVTAEMPWRAWILTTDEALAQLVVVVNHMAADGVGSLILEADFRAYLGGTGETLEPAPTPIELAIRQTEGEGASRIRGAERLWRKTYESAPRLTGAEKPAERVGATLHTGIPLPMAHEGATKLDISLGSLILAAYYRALRQVTGTQKLLLYPMTNNRFDSETATLVSSLNQWVPLLLEFGDDEPFTEIAQRVHWKTFNALKYGVCGPDTIIAMRDEFEAAQGDLGHYYNPIIAPIGFPSQDVQVPSHVEWYEPARSTGPGFYLIVRGLTSLDLIVRTNRPGYGKEEIEGYLASIQDSLRETIGG